MADIDKRELQEKLEAARRELEERPNSWSVLERVARCMRLLEEPGTPELFREAAALIPERLPEVQRKMSAGNHLRLAGDEEEAWRYFEQAYAVMSQRLSEGGLGTGVQEMADCSFLLGAYEETERLADLYREETNDAELKIFTVGRLAQARRTGDSALAGEMAERLLRGLRGRGHSLAAVGAPSLWDLYELALQPVEATEGKPSVSREVEDKPEPNSEPDGRDLRGADLQEADLQEEWLMGADLREANLEGADLYEASLVDAHLIGADLRRANLEGADLTDANLEDADLRWAKLTDATVDGARLRRANLEGADLSGASLNLATLEMATLQDTNLDGADLREANLSGLDLRATHGLKDANLDGVNLTGAILYGANLAGCVLTSAILKDADLSGADLREADLRQADLTGANLTGADLRGARLEGTNLEGAILDDASR